MKLLMRIKVYTVLNNVGYFSLRYLFYACVCWKYFFMKKVMYNWEHYLCLWKDR